MFTNFLRAAILVMSLSSFSAHAVLVTSLSNLNIGGTLYNAAFHDGKPFDDLFDADNNAVFDDADGSMFNRAPTFWNNPTLALAAANTIAAALGSDDHTSMSSGPTGIVLSDGFFVPFDIISSTAFIHNFQGAADDDTTLAADIVIDNEFYGQSHVGAPIVTFQRVSTTVPLPSTLALTGLVLGIMGFIGRRRRAD